MPVDEDRMPEDEVDDQDSSDEGDSGETENQPEGLTLEKLAAEVAMLRQSQAKTLRDFNAAVGRVQSVVSRIDSGRGDTDQLTKQLRSQIGAVDKAIDAILEDETMSPEIKERARAARSNAAATSELEDIKAQLEALKNPAKPDAPDDSAVLSFEDSIVEEIESYGLDPDDAAFDWKGEATQIMLTKGADETRKYFRRKVKDILAEKAAAERRQSRKESSSKKPDASGSNMREFDPDQGNEANIKKLIDLGIINVS